MINLNHNSKVLIVNLGGIGDVLISQPAIRALKNEFNCSIAMLVVSRVKGLVSRWSFVDEVYGISKKDKLADIKKIMELRKKKFALAVNMRTIHSRLSSFKIKLMFNMISPEFSAGRNTDNRARFFDFEVLEKEYGVKHEIDYCNEQIKCFGIKEIDNSIEWYWNSADFDKITELVNTEYVVVHPGAAMPSKMWPVERFADICDYLIKEKQTHKIVVTGDLREKEIALKIKEKFKDNIVDLTGKTSLLETAALISRCRLLITNDTGILHIGASLDMPMIALFGPGDFIRYNPQVISEKARAIYKEPECGPCEKYNCKNLKCQIDITVDEVKREIDKLV